LTFSFNWHGPAANFPADSIDHSCSGVEDRLDRVANALKRAALPVLEALEGHDVTVSGYGHLPEGETHGAVASLHISIPQPVSAASPPSLAASAPEGSPTATAPGTEAGGGPGEPLPSGGAALDEAAAPSLSPAQPEDEPGDPSRLDVAASPSDPPQD